MPVGGANCEIIPGDSAELSRILLEQGRTVRMEYDSRPPLVSDPDYQPYDGRNLSYGGTYPGSIRSSVIRSIEWCTGKITLMRLVRAYEQSGRRTGESFWGAALRQLEIELLTPPEEIARIPKHGPAILAANHPHGLVDGLILAELAGRVRQDFKILTRGLLTEVPEIQDNLLPVAFPHEADSVRKNLAMRKEAMEHLAAGGVIILFPAGAVAAAPSWWADAEEGVWAPFTSKMILRSGADVILVRFTGQNSRVYQWANFISKTVRQGLLLHEIVMAIGKPQSPIIGKAIGHSELSAWSQDPVGFMSWLRTRTLSLQRD